MKVEPMPGYILVEPNEAETQTASGLYLPDNAKEKPAQGKVLAVGKPYFDTGHQVVCGVKAGDEVLYKKWGGDDVRVGGREYKLVRFDDLMARITK